MTGQTLKEVETNIGGCRWCFAASGSFSLKPRSARLGYRSCKLLIEENNREQEEFLFLFFERDVKLKHLLPESEKGDEGIDAAVPGCYEFLAAGAAGFLAESAALVYPSLQKQATSLCVQLQCLAEILHSLDKMNKRKEILKLLEAFTHLSLVYALLDD
ncbi:hypothetical protein MUK42_33512 [Musa troglodytarum]|uniref:Uncharacterized protein n=1 Tax=Musa troglodytarum TaxID=320322 RepID=A0A9E7IIF4_9LILI|nr:hypothetical protein MUK42_33512 [Musa troglodytarum]